jgi:hypothetical protein
MAGINPTPPNSPTLPSGLELNLAFNGIPRLGTINPGEPNVAVNATVVVETANVQLEVWPKGPGSNAGGPPTVNESLNALFGISGGDTCTDPTIVHVYRYDRFFLACSDVGNDRLYFAVSTSSSATSWCTAHINPPNFLDFPSVTAGYDKLMVVGNLRGSTSWAIGLDEASFASCSSFIGVCYATLHQTNYRASEQEDPEYDTKAIAVNNGYLWILNATGQAGSGIRFREYAIETKDRATLPDVPIRGGSLGAGYLTNDFLNAVQEYDHTTGHYIMEAASMENCYQPRCIEVLRLGFASGLGAGKTKVLHTFRFGSPGFYFTFRAVALDQSGFIIATFDDSSSTATPYATMAGMDPKTARVKWTTTIFNASAGTTACGDGTCNERWGDYLGAARDDTNPAQVYVASLYQGQSGELGWGSVIAAATSAGVE